MFGENNQNMRILITGGTGLLGKALIESAGGKYEVLATFVGDYEIDDTKQASYRKLDIRDKDAYLRLFKDFRPLVAIHTAGINSPDYAQQNAEIAREINITGTENIIRACEEAGAKLIYISSNAIYDGNKPPYQEEDMPGPVNAYGRIKLEGELITKKAKVACAVIRPILMYGWNYAFERANVVSIGIAKLRKKEKFFVYDDVYYNPLYYFNCAEAVWAVIEKNKFETFNIAGKDRVSIYGLLKEAARAFELDENLLVPVEQGFFKELVKRPRDTSYKTTKMECVLGVEPLGIYQGLRLMRQEENKPDA